MKIQEYQVIQGDKSRYFSEDVNNLIAQGFQPYGPMIVQHVDGADRYYQAMVKKEKDRQ